MRGKQMQGNMMVPIDLLDPILDDLLRYGRVNRPARPWLGMYATEVEGQLAVAGLAPRGPSERAGLQVGDVLLEVAGRRAKGLAELFRGVWALGPAGVDVPVSVRRNGDTLRFAVHTADRNDFLKKPHLH